MNALQALSQYGQSVWLDYIQRQLITSGELRRFVDEDGLAGLTSNPAIFEKAIAGSPEYAEVLAKHAASGLLGPKALYEAMAIEDIQMAADVLSPVHVRSGGRDGFVSLEVSPELAHDTAGTLDEARRLWRAVSRQNLMVKVPATAEGLPAIRQLITEGINVNVTLLFSGAMYEKVADAYVGGLEARAARGDDVSHLASVASFFVSRIDTAVDAQLSALVATTENSDVRARLATLAGQAAIANARLVYQQYKDLFSGARWRTLADRGARTQRLLWASTGTKNPAYRDTLYVEELIGADTVNTIPPATYAAFREHGQLRSTLDASPDEAARVMEALAAAGISMAQITDGLLVDGLRQFADAFRTLLRAVAERQASLTAGDRGAVDAGVAAPVAIATDGPRGTA